ncbi:hypothetical protein [Brevundimonas sp.]|uniref:hypothetical protein n=1 Tax=Brevundimonas sp. TaxID=1871086 RepID=UPI002D58D0E5|nr:hypothetical protein [Brevundimonas sp.]HYD28545.1 hypothetical protein [Brevundimonas sp.]
MTRLIIRSLLFASALAAVGCASAPPGRPAGRPEGAPPLRTALFISPFGEPFLADPGEPWPVSDWFLGADQDLDGTVTFEEFETDGRRWFGQLDQDRSGRLEQAELAAYENGLRALAQGAGRSRPGGGGGPGGDRQGGPATRGLAGPAPQNGPAGGMRRGPRGGRGMNGYGPVAEAGFFNLPQPVKAADVNVDQKVTGEEWAAATGRWFVALDADRDGRLTLAGLPRTPLQAQVEAGRR